MNLQAGIRIPRRPRDGKDGKDGNSAPLLVIAESAQIMICNDDNIAETGQTIEIEAKLQNVTGTADFVAKAYNVSGSPISGNITLGGTGNVRTLTNLQWLSTYKKVVITVTLGSLTDVTTIHRLNKPASGGVDGVDGVDAVVGFLTNENITVQASATGVVGLLDTAVGYFRLYSGVTPVTSGITFSRVSQTGCTVTINATTGYYTVNTVTADNAAAIFKVKYGTLEIEKVLTLSKSKAGSKGDTGDKGEDGKDAIAPIIIDGFWAFWDSELNEFVESEFSAIGDDGHSPEIRDGYWWEWNPAINDYQNTGVKAEGDKGDKGDKGEDGKDGQDGESKYLWIRYSQNSNGNPFVTDPTNAKYIGIATTLTDSPPSNYLSYDWSLIKGTDGIAGEDGEDGQTSYLHIKYSNDGTTFTANNGETVGAWIGTYVDFVEEDSMDFSKYTWNKVKGEDGTDGTDGKDGEPGDKGEPGENGLPGQIPIQKEWVVGDVHRNTDEIVDYIYVRGADKNTSYWYKLASKGTKPDVGAPPSHGTTPPGYERIDWLKELAVNVLLAEEANLAGFIFKGGQLISVRGTVGGVDADYSGQAGFVPNLILDGAEGDVKITGTVNANSGSIGVLDVDTSGQVKLEDPDTGNKRLSFIKSKIPLLADLLSTTNFGDSATAIGTSISIPTSGSSTSNLSGTLNVDKDGADISIAGGAALNLEGSFGGTADSSVLMSLYLMRNGSKYRNLQSVMISKGANIENSTVYAQTLTGMPSGNYRLMLEVTKVGTGLVSGQGSVASVPMSWTFQQSGIRNFLFGLNGFLSYFSDKHIYFSEEDGFDLKGKTNMPGVLLSTTVSSTGVFANTWGAKKHASLSASKVSTGTYDIYHSIGHSTYNISANAYGNRTISIVSKSADRCRIQIYNGATLIDGQFDITLTGNNY